MKNAESLLIEMDKAKLVAVVTIPDAKLAVPLANAMIAGGVKILEITLRNDQAIGALKALQAANLSFHYGAGTVRTIEQAKDNAELSGAVRSTVEVIDIEEIPFTYMPGKREKVRVRVKGSIFKEGH